MRNKKIIIAVLVMFVLSTGVVFAAAVNGEFNGFPIVNVKVNEKAVQADVPGIVMQGRTLLPVRAVAENVGALVSWDQKTMTASIEKPEAEILFVEDIQEFTDGTWGLVSPYNRVDRGYGEPIVVYYEISNIDRDEISVQLVGHNIKGEAICSGETVITTDSKAGVTGYMVFDDLGLNTTGEYAFDLQIMHDGKYQTIATKTLFVE